MNEDRKQLRRLRSQFIRETVTPIMKAAGYRKSSQTYRYLREGGHQAVFWFRAPPAPMGPIDLIVEQGLLVEDWHKYLRWTWGVPEPPPPRPAFPPFEKADAVSGPFQHRLGSPGGGRAVSGGVWRFDPQDEQVVESFTRLLRQDAATFAAMTDPVAFIHELRSSQFFTPMSGPPAQVILTVILAAQGRDDEARESLASTTDWFRYNDLAGWVDACRDSGD